MDYSHLAGHALDLNPSGLTLPLDPQLPQRGSCPGQPATPVPPTQKRSPKSSEADSRQSSGQLGQRRVSNTAVPQAAATSWQTSDSTPLRPDQQTQDGMQQTRAVSQAAARQPAHQQSPAETSPLQAPSQISRAKPSQGQRPQGRTPVTDPSAGEMQRFRPAPQAGANPALHATSAANDAASIAGYESFSRYSDSAADDQSTVRTAHEPHPAPSNVATSYPSYDAYNARSNATTSASYPDPMMQAAPHSSSSGKWPGSQSRKSHSYSTNNTSYSIGSSSTTNNNNNTSYNLPSSSQSSQSFNVHLQATSQSRATSVSSSYGQQGHRQQAAYNSYSSPPHASSSSQQSWYGFGSPGNSSTAYGNGDSARAVTARLLQPVGLAPTAGSSTGR